MNVRALATGLAVNRVLFGTGFVVAPERSSRGWISIDAALASGADGPEPAATEGAAPG